MDTPNLLSERRANPSCDNYVFVSYSHKDDAVVYDDLTKLYDRCLNFWFDKELTVGDKWDEIVREVIEHENCKGALLYITPSSLRSEAVEKEIETLFKKKEINPDFTIVLVSPYGKSVLDIVKEIFLASETLSGNALDDFFPQTRLRTVVDNLTDNILYVAPSAENTCEHIDAIESTFKKKGLPVFADDESLLSKYSDKLKAKPIGTDGYQMEFGGYPSEFCEQAKSFPEGRTTRDNQEYYTRASKTYLYTPIDWYMLSLNKNLLTLCPKEAMVFDLIENIERTLNSDFLELAFAELKSAVERIELPTAEQMTQVAELFGEEQLKINCYAKRLSPERGPNILFVKTENGFVLYNHCFKKMNVPIRSHTAGYALPIVTIDLNKI